MSDQYTSPEINWPNAQEIQERWECHWKTGFINGIKYATDNFLASIHISNKEELIDKTITYLFEQYFTKKDQDTSPTLEEVIAENYDPNQPLGDETNEI